MIKNETKIRVRYGETDTMGYAHHANYFLYFEIGRTELIRNLGLSYKEMEDKGIMLPVYVINCKFHAPAIYDDELIIKTCVREFSGVKVNFEYDIYNQNNQLICSGNTVLVFTDAKTRKPIRPPQFFNDDVKGFF